jgi:ABC-type branched-subunit amino acid transport system ATPase component
MDPNDETVMLRAKCKRFRILVVGRANAGKTTILKAICGSTENGKVEIDPLVVERSLISKFN